MSSKFALFILALICIACISKDQTNQGTKASQYFYVGTYTNGDSEGIYKYQLLEDGQLKKIKLMANADDPSFLAKSSDGKYLLAVNETSDNTGNGGAISSFVIEDDELVFIDKKPSAGDYPCFVSCNEEGFVLTANYGSGTIGLLRIDQTGKLNGPLDISQHMGRGTNARQDGPHAHSAWFVPNQNIIIAVDLGTNELWFSKLDSNRNELIPSDPEKLAMAPESGPRHLDFHPNGKWIYVINELSSTVTQLQIDSSGQYEMMSTMSTLPSDFTGENLCADIHVSLDGKFLYASNRGHNSIVIYQLNEMDGKLTLVGHEGVHGDWPRNFTLSQDGAYLLVANQKSNNIVSFKRDTQTGKLDFVAEIQAPSPVCLLF